VLAAAVGGGATLLADRDSDRGSDRGQQRGSGNAAAQPSPSAAPRSLVTSSPPLPTDQIAPFPGWTFYEEPGRFRMVAPIGWVIEHDGTTTRLKEPDGPKVLTINLWPVPDSGALAAAQARHAAWTTGAEDSPPDYQLVSLRQIDYFDGGVEWEYTYTDPAIGPMHTNSRWFVQDGHCYAIGVSLPAYDIGARSNYFNQLIGGFGPRA
jgi:hypothetical protein